MRLFVTFFVLLVSAGLCAQESPVSEEEFAKRVRQAWESNRRELEPLYWQWGDFAHQQGNRRQALRAWLSVLEVTIPAWATYQKLARHLAEKGYLEEAVELLSLAVQHLALTAEEYFQGAALALEWQKEVLSEQFLLEILQHHWPNEGQLLPRATQMLLHLYQERSQRLAENADAKTRELLARKIQQLREGIRPMDCKIMLTWDTATDVDLWVTNPQLKRCFYSNQITSEGEKLHNDDTDGYGPETFTILKAKPGRYKIQAHYFRGSSKTTVIAQITLGVGSGREIQRRYTATLEKTGDLKELTDIYIPKDLTGE